jgi:hypothetical protein
MKKSRPSFILAYWAAFAVAAQAQSAPRVAGQGGPATSGAQSSASTDGQALVERVEQRLEQFSSLSAKIRMQIDLFDQQASGAGLYFQKRDGSRTLSRLSLKSQFRDTAFALLQVNDGRRFWTYCELPDGPSLNKLDLERINEQSRNRGTPGPSLPSVGGLPIGGLPKLLAGLRQNFQFTQLGETQLADRRVVAIDGSWRPDRLAAAIPDQRSAIEAGRPVDLKRLPARLPEHVVLYIGQSDFLLHRIDYLRRNDRAGGAGQGSVLPGYREMVTIEFFDVSVNQPIDSKEFQYQPPKRVKVIDATDAYLKSSGATANK